MAGHVITNCDFKLSKTGEQQIKPDKKSYRANFLIYKTHTLCG